MTAEEWEAEVQEVNQDDEELNPEEDDEEQLDAEPGVSGISRFPCFPGIQASNFPSLPFPWHFLIPVPFP